MLKTNKFQMTKAVKEVVAIENRLIDLNSCGFKSVITDWGKYYAHNGQVMVTVTNTPEAIAECANQAEYDDVKQFTTDIRKNIKAMLPELFYIKTFNGSKTTVNDLLPEELTNDLAEMKEAGFTGTFYVHYTKQDDDVYEITLTYKAYNGYFHRNK